MKYLTKRIHCIPFISDRSNSKFFRGIITKEIIMSTMNLRSVDSYNSTWALYSFWFSLCWSQVRLYLTVINFLNLHII